jgi:hypothetical protein
MNAGVLTPEEPESTRAQDDLGLLPLGDSFVGASGDKHVQAGGGGDVAGAIDSKTPGFLGSPAPGNGRLGTPWQRAY